MDRLTRRPFKEFRSMCSLGGRVPGVGSMAVVAVRFRLLGRFQLCNPKVSSHHMAPNLDSIPADSDVAQLRGPCHELGSLSALEGVVVNNLCTQMQFPIHWKVRMRRSLIAKSPGVLLLTENAGLKVRGARARVRCVRFYLSVCLTMCWI